MATTSPSDGVKLRYSVSDNVSVLYQVYCSYIILYRNAGAEEDFLSPKALKQSLDALVRRFYPPIAGWFEARNGDVDVDVVCYRDRRNDPPFSTQTLEMDYNEAARHVRESNTDLFVPQCPPPLIAPDSTGIPMILVKTTHLASGEAAVLGISYHHSLMDGSAFWMFMTNWASVSRQLRAQVDETELSLPYPPAFGMPTTEHLCTPERPFEHAEYALVDADKVLREFKAGQDAIVETVFTVSAEQQQDIRQMARSEGVSFTEMLCAVFWKGASDARVQARPSVAAEATLFTCAVNPRARLGVPDTQCASPVVNVATSSTIGKIAQLDVGSVAQLVHQAIGRCTGPYVASSYAFMRAQRSQELDDERSGRPGKKLMLVYVYPWAAKCTMSSSRTFPIYQADFGVGPPVLVRAPFLPFDGCVRIWPTPQYSPAPGALGAPLEVYMSLPDYVDPSSSPLLRRFARMA
ncbi:hypothetical protein LPJ61_000327 [Coemansia biformis]|uniref:Transferase n=1 Tax=Coemansia biformis TaxID=1286918 RepID=A0A9W7YH86_9FUNG|nr:hypothetical protein LPJ61_000327 [Coemansia biformis]